MLDDMTVKVRLFAMLRERAGKGAIDVDVTDGSTAAQVAAELGEKHGLGDLLERMPIVMAVNRDYADPGTILKDGDELALIPPVSGGAPARLHARVIDVVPSADRLTEFVRDGAAGGIVVFHGTTRNDDRLDYEAYLPMAEEKITAILSDVADKHSLIALAAEHRIGAVPLSETSVVIAASAAHRAEAFAGAREALDRIKSEVPIWKKEISRGEDGESARWVEGVAPSVPSRDNIERREAAEAATIGDQQ